MNEKMNKALVYFGREDLTDGLYENDIDDNVEVFLTIRQMIKLYNLQSKIDKAIILIDKYLEMVDNPDINMQCVKDILKEDNNE